MKEKIQQQWVCLREAGNLIGLDYRTVKKIITANADKIKYKRIGKKIMIDKADLLNLLSRKEVIRY